MYIPKHFANNDTGEIVAFMQKYSFGSIVTSANNLPVATHLPFIIEQRDGDIYILSHFAKANPQANRLDNTVLVIFTEPHAYISPKHYQKEQSVPTWNYIAVHAYGEATIIADTEGMLQLMEKSITFYDTAYLAQWNGLPDEFKLRMLNGIIAFEIKVTDLQAKNKLSQNRSEVERKNIITEFEASADNNEVMIAQYMKKG
ncbi:PaiB family negative transcriptional regulator [Mucilaginibacter gracilis]|uniref:PaiB family negative transcriptional regulator n=1 Tax=Mucilaginibacter gracilis TaxID=423350 RepID=A0A495J1T9_9SPHI|nr:FMN-binding negative transcriptional regulator [Mucilaginibacter gracilis]RKR82773.1 PaiB family negative transcriptional regulator [Mucilaginibacter gracilis]